MLRTAEKPKGDTYYNKRAQNYDKRRTKQEWWHVEQQEMKSLLEGLPRDLKVVDIPFGTGRFVPYYAKFGYSIFGLDASNHMIDAAKDSLGKLFDGCTTSVGDAGELPFADGEFDLLVSTRFLRDIILFDHARRVIAEFARVTSKYAIIQLGERKDGVEAPQDDEVMGSKMTGAAVDKLLLANGLEPVERRLVKTHDGGEINHVLCHKTKP